MDTALDPTGPADPTEPTGPAEPSGAPTPWAHALGALGYGFFAWAQPGAADTLRPLSAHVTRPEVLAPTAEVLHLQPVPPPAHEPVHESELPFASAPDPYLAAPAGPAAPPADEGEAQDAVVLPLRRSLLEEDLAAAWTLDELPDGPPTDLAALVAEETALVPPAPVEEPESAYAARRDTIAMLEEIAFLDE